MSRKIYNRLSLMAVSWLDESTLGVQHRLFFAQVEFCDNLIFRRRAAVDALEQRLLDANRSIGQPNKLTLIFGRRITRRHADKLQTVTQDLNLPNPRSEEHTSELQSR